MSARGGDFEVPFDDRERPLDDLVDIEIERALSTVPRPVARAEFKHRLRARFLAVASESSQEPATSPSLRRRMLRLGAVAAAAAVLLVLFAVRPRGPRWTIADPDVASTVFVDGESLRTDQRSEIEKKLADARIVETTDRPLRLRWDKDFVIELAERSRIEISALDKSEPFALRAELGAVRVVTGAAFAGSHMRVSTSDLDLRVTGTAFAVDLLDAEKGTCVCCLRGAVEVRSAVISEPRSIPEGEMCIVWRDKSVNPKWAPSPRSARRSVEGARGVRAGRLCEMIRSPGFGP